MSDLIVVFILTSFLIGLFLLPMIINEIYIKRNRNKNGYFKCQKCKKTFKVVYYFDTVFGRRYKCEKCINWDKI